MIPNTVYDYCCEDISLIENYEAALADTSETEWVCHHKLRIELNKTKEELIEMGLYLNRPACELCLMTLAEHTSLHNSYRIGEKNPLYGTQRSQETRKKISEAEKGKYVSQETRQKISKISSKLCKGEGNPMYGKHHSQETRAILSAKRKIKYKYLTPEGETRIMDKTNATRYHKDWTIIGPVL